MTEPTTTATETPGIEPPAGAEAPAEFAPITSQEEFDRRIAERINRTKNQFKDYADLKRAAEELAQIKAANQTEAERLAQETTRWQSEAEKWRTAAVGSRVQALASLDFADPTDAVTALGGDLAKYLDAGGQIDEDAIRADLADVLERKPHWRRPTEQQPGPRLPAPNPAQGTGARPAPATPADELAAILQRQLR